MDTTLDDLLAWYGNKIEDARKRLRQAALEYSTGPSPPDSPPAKVERWERARSWMRAERAALRFALQILAPIMTDDVEPPAIARGAARVALERLNPRELVKLGQYLIAAGLERAGDLHVPQIANHVVHRVTP